VLSFFVLFLIAYIVYLHAKIVRTGLTKAENPVFVFEKPELPKKLQAVQDRLDQWRLQGLLTLEEYEKMAHLVKEDAAREAKPS
jgi:hypothetical protein